MRIMIFVVVLLYFDMVLLQFGDIVVIVLLFGFGNEENIQCVVGYFEFWGFKVWVGEYVFMFYLCVFYFVGFDDFCCVDFVDVWFDFEVDVVVMVCGGYGVLCLLDGIDWVDMCCGVLCKDG